jgi:alanyl aminopeptidase
MNSDGLMSARRIRQSVLSKDDIENAFDSITYEKGAAVLTMFEAWIGPDRFRKGVQRYLREHAYGSATSSDFLAAVSAEAGRDVGPAFSTFLDQPGVPLVSVELRCDKGVKPRVELTQERYLPAGSQGAAREQKWQVPVCVRHGAGDTTGRACTLLTERTGTLELADAKRCPDWLLPNDGANGYYHVAYGAELLDKLIKSGSKALSVPERLSVLRDARAQMKSGKLPAAQLLARLPALAKDPNPHVVDSAAGIVAALPDRLVPEALRPRFARFVQKTFGPQARALGWAPKPGEAEEVRLLRPTLVRLVADRGDDEALLAEAASLTARWLDDPGGLAPDMVKPIVTTAASRGDRALFDRLYAAATREKDQNRRNDLLAAMSSFRDPAIVEDSLSLVLKDVFDLRDALSLLSQDERMIDTSLAFYRRSFDALVAKLPGSVKSDTLYVAAPLCDASRRPEVESLFKGRVEELPGGPRTLAQVLEMISLCSALRDAHQASLTEFLERY